MTMSSPPCAFGEEFFVGAVLVVLDDGFGGVEDGLGGAVVLF